MRPTSRRPHRIARTLVLMSGLLVGGCAAPETSPTVAIPSRTSAAPTASPTTSVARSAADAPITSEQPLFAFKGDERRIRIYRPDPSPSGKVPLLLFLHALGESPAKAASETGFDRLAGRERFIAVFPPASGRGWAARVTSGLSDDGVDARWLTALLDHLLATEPIDPDRVFVAGFSIGAVMTDKVACQLADRVAAAVVVAGAPWVGADCAPKQPVSMLIIHGTDDPTFPYSGAMALATQWRGLDHCRDMAPEATVGSDAMRVSAIGCASDTAVDLVTVRDGVHMWFTDPDATTLAWEFLTDHGR